MTGSTVVRAPEPCRIRPIRREPRFVHSIDWPQRSALIRFQRAGGRCEACRRPHGQRVFHLGDGRGWDAEVVGWRDGRGRIVRIAIGGDDGLGAVRAKRVLLTAAHRDHNSTNNAGGQPHGLLPARPRAARRARASTATLATVFRGEALGDLFRGRTRCRREGGYASATLRKRRVRSGVSAGASGSGAGALAGAPGFAGNVRRCWPNPRVLASAERRLE